MVRPSPQSPALSSQHLDTIVRVSGFVKRYKKHVAVNGVDLTIQKGEIYGLIGPDGAGKSSLMKAIAGVLADRSAPKTPDLGGKAGTKELGAAIAAALG